MRITLASVKASQIPKVLGLASCSAEFLAIVNEAVQRLVMGPEVWWEVYQRYRFQVTNGKVTWPRQVASVIALEVDGQPYRLHNEWFEYLQTGFGRRTSTCFNDTAGIDRGTSCLIKDINTATTANPMTLKFYSSVSETTTEKIVVTGWDNAGNWIRTQVNGAWVDGEHIQVPPLSTTPRTSAFNWSSVSNIIKPITNGEVLLYESDTVTGDQRKIGHYETDETHPRYRRTLVGNATCEDETDPDCCHTITATVKLEFIPVRNDNDFLLIGNIPALKEMCMAVQRRERGSLGEAQAYENKAFEIMDREVSHYIGAASRVPINVVGDGFAMFDIPSLQ